MLLCSKSKNRPFFPSFPFKCHICPFSPAHFCHFVDGIPVSTSRQGSAPFQHIAFTQSGPKMHSAESLPFSPSSYFWLNHTFSPICFTSAQILFCQAPQQDERYLLISRRRREKKGRREEKGKKKEEGKKEEAK